MSWYVIRTKSRQEARAVFNLENQDFKVYCPWLIRKNTQREALFTGYLFVQVDAFERSYASLRSTRGVLSILKFGETWSTVDDEFIDYLKSNENKHCGVPLFKPQQEVIFKDGPFKGIEAVYLCANGEERAMVLISILNRLQKILVEEHLLQAV
ncbi:hypothetical protein FT643_12305 [Ketobacter sp. MCCC 1A13808]|uniref:transcription termination/antitermination NusG family protein n=1 Tax=Ketobacter sp. MCCC 1A13808 TaxID=2602738 RepID=UPI000F26DCB2|nr:transcription termination/antitermination NusG family protein [Ketobacter sp. MCCC 1A13808]MVF12924.1 hypothetical protein [Ketobacter sp. MCCC 1A13808]RLP54409.1 MAG: hypothetical protein D6160_10260 [Ketobacter sp.]